MRIGIVKTTGKGTIVIKSKDNSESNIQAAAAAIEALGIGHASSPQDIPTDLLPDGIDVEWLG